MTLTNMVSGISDLLSAKGVVFAPLSMAPEVARPRAGASGVFWRLGYNAANVLNSGPGPLVRMRPLEGIMSNPILRADNKESAGQAPAELAKYLRQYFVHRTLNADGLREYLASAKPTVETFYQALVAISSDQTEITGKTLEVIRSAVAVCEKNMSMASTSEERQAVREELRRIVEDARGAQDTSAKWYHYALYGAVVVATAVLGAATTAIAMRGDSRKK